MARKKLKRGGLTNGKSHANGGIPMTVKSTGQKVELEGGEGIINKHVMANKDKYSFEGRKMTACEVASELNQETGNGVAFKCEQTKHTDMTPTDASTGFDAGGEIQEIIHTQTTPDSLEIDAVEGVAEELLFSKGGQPSKYTYGYFKATDEGLNPKESGKYLIERSDGAILGVNRKADVLFIIKNEKDFEKDFDYSITDRWSGEKLDSVWNIRVIEDFDVDEIRNKFSKGGDISEKIEILKEEGYPHDQAVAIAHSMKERGEFAKGGQLYVSTNSPDTEEKLKEIFDKLPPYYDVRGSYIYRNTSATPAYGDLKYADIGNIQRTTIDGKELAIAKIVGDTEYRFVEETFQLKKFPTAKVEWNGIKYNVGKLKSSRYGSSTPLGDYVWYAPIVDKILKGIASPLFITKYKGWGTDWNIVDGWSGTIGGIEAYKVNDGYDSRSKRNVVDEAMRKLHKLISFGFGLPVIIDILKKYNVSDILVDIWAVGQQSQTLIIDAEQAEGRANVINDYGNWKAFKEDKNLHDITLSPNATRIYQTIPAINPQFSADAALDAEAYVKLTNEIVDVLMSKDFAALLVMEYNVATIASLELNSNGILSPSYHFSTKSVATKKKGGKFNRNEAFDDSPQNKDIARLQNLMALYHDTPNALKEMNKAIRELEKEMEVELNLEGKKNFNLDKAFNSYFNIAGKGYTGKRGRRTQALAPSGGQSELNAKQYDIIRTSNFKQWFGDWETSYETKNYNGVSKVVDSDGEPKVVYHGTMPPSDFIEFKFDTFPIMYFSEDEYYAEFFAKETSPTNPSIMFEFFLNIRNPLEMVEFGVDRLSVKDLKFILWEKHGVKLDVSKVPNHALNLPLKFWEIIRGYKKLGLNNMFDTIQKYGYDGIHYIEDNRDWKYQGKDSATIGWMMFDKDKAKLADGRNTTFSSFRDDFRFNKGGDVTE